MKDENIRKIVYSRIACFALFNFLILFHHRAYLPERLVTKFHQLEKQTNNGNRHPHGLINKKVVNDRTQISVSIVVECTVDV